jgi:hypothetical protein
MRKWPGQEFWMWANMPSMATALIKLDAHVPEINMSSWIDFPSACQRFCINQSFWIDYDFSFLWKLPQDSTRISANM